MWEGLGELPNPYGYVTDDSAANHALMARGYAWSSLEADDYFRGEYLRAWRERPGFVIRTIAAREPRVLFESEHLQPLFFGRARQLLDWGGLGALCLVLWFRRHDATTWFILAVPPLYAMATIGLLHYEPRYVRYVQLSYMLAVTLLGAGAWRRVARITPAVAVGTAVAIALAAGYVARELLALHVAAVQAVAAG